MVLENISDEELFKKLIEVDGRLFQQGIGVKRRAWDVPLAIMKDYGYENAAIVVSGFGKSADMQRLEDMFHDFYRPQDLAVGGHIGVFMYRDVFALVDLPRVYGTRHVDLIEAVKLSDLQKIAIASEPQLFNAMLDQVIDIFDIQFGVPAIKEPYKSNGSALKFINLAQLHLHGAAAILTGGYDHRGAIQSALLATELALKAGASVAGISEETLKFKPYGHNTAKSLEAAQGGLPDLDHERIERVIKRQPDYVNNRYTFDQPPRRKAGHLVMGAQFVVAEVVRQLTDTDGRGSLSSPIKRCYPA